MFKKLSFIVVMLVLAFSMAFSTVHTVPFQGTLFQSLDGVAVPNGAYTMTVQLFDNADGTGTALWTEEHTGVSIIDGSFGIYLGETVGIPEGVAAVNTLFVKVGLSGQAVANNLIPVTSHLWAQFAKVAQSANTAGTANIALSLLNSNVSQFTNDAGYAKTVDIAGINVNNATYAVKAGELTSMSNTQFTNEAGYAKTVDLVAAKVNTANIALQAISMPASGLTGALIINGTTVQAAQFKAVQPYQINGYTGIDTTLDILVNVTTSTFGFVTRTYKTVVIKGGLVVSESALFTRL